MLAHIRASDGAEQPLKAHCEHVAALCGRYAQRLGLAQTAALIGLMHDMGKATAAFEGYLRAAGRQRSPHNHAPTGAIYAYRRWFDRQDAPQSVRAAAQMISLCILGHHAGLSDCLDSFGKSPYLKKMTEEKNLRCYDEAVGRFLEHVASEQELDARFALACGEIGAALSMADREADAFDRGMTCRLLLSILVDADRWDSACFEYGQDALEQTPGPDFGALLGVFEDYRKARLSGEGEINRIRAEISDVCHDRADCTPGIFTLSVPTGGGKTLSSLRFALRHAGRNGQSRIFYIIPYNTILDQNARDIREALGEYPSILEHHANVVVEAREGRTREEEQEVYRRLTERWDSDIILTSLVQFLNACYAAPNTDARRLHRLTGAVLIFDEIQSLPKHCRRLFEEAVRFLCSRCGCTAVLCTATQPRLSFSPAPVELMPDVQALGERLRRVRYAPELDAVRDVQEAAARIVQMLETRSVLTIVNMKKTALAMFEKTRALLEERGVPLADACLDLPDGALADAAYACPDDHILCVYLSTLLCPAHRKRLIARIKAWLRAGRRVLCVSTALIEAGINVSFPVVIRALCGLPGIVQAAGRANRNMEYGEGEVLVWDFREQHLERLPDVQTGANVTRSLLRDADFAASMDAPASLARYFAREEEEIGLKRPGCYACPVPALGDTVSNLLARNGKRKGKADGFVSTRRLVLRQSFQEAYSGFEVIPDATRPLLVPFMEGAELIAALAGGHGMREEIALLRRAQAYSVSVYEQGFAGLYRDGALYPVGESGAIALEEGYYDAECGLTEGRRELTLLEY